MALLTRHVTVMWGFRSGRREGDLRSRAPTISTSISQESQGGNTCGKLGGIGRRTVGVEHVGQADPCCYTVLCLRGTSQIGGENVGLEHAGQAYVFIYACQYICIDTNIYV